MTENNNNLKCECGKPAVWLIIDCPMADTFFTPVCEEHFQELKDTEGEMNLDFELKLISLLTLDDVIKKANEHFIVESKRYEALLEELSKLQKQLKLM